MNHKNRKNSRIIDCKIVTERGYKITQIEMQIQNIKTHKKHTINLLFYSPFIDNIMLQIL